MGNGFSLDKIKENSYSARIRLGRYDSNKDGIVTKEEVGENLQSLLNGLKFDATIKGEDADGIKEALGYFGGSASAEATAPVEASTAAPQTAAPQQAPKTTTTPTELTKHQRRNLIDKINGLANVSITIDSQEYMERLRDEIRNDTEGYGGDYSPVLDKIEGYINIINSSKIETKSDIDKIYNYIAKGKNLTAFEKEIVNALLDSEKRVLVGRRAAEIHKEFGKIFEENGRNYTKALPVLKAKYGIDKFEEQVQQRETKVNDDVDFSTNQYTQYGPKDKTIADEKGYIQGYYEFEAKLQNQIAAQVRRDVHDETTTGKTRKEILAQVTKEHENDPYYVKIAKGQKGSMKTRARRNTFVQNRDFNLASMSRADLIDIVGERVFQILKSSYLADKKEPYDLRELAKPFKDRMGADYRPQKSYKDPNASEREHIKDDYRGILKAYGNQIDNAFYRKMRKLYEVSGDYGKFNIDGKDQVADAAGLLAGLGVGLKEGLDHAHWAFDGVDGTFSFPLDKINTQVIEQEIREEISRQLQAQGIDGNLSGNIVSHIEINITETTTGSFDIVRTGHLDSALRAVGKTITAATLTTMAVKAAVKVLANAIMGTEFETTCISVTDFNNFEDKYKDEDQYKAYLRKKYEESAPAKAEMLCKLIDMVRDKDGKFDYGTFQNILRIMAGVGSPMNGKECQEVEFPEELLEEIAKNYLKAHATHGSSETTETKEMDVPTGNKIAVGEPQLVPARGVVTLNATKSSNAQLNKLLFDECCWDKIKEFKEKYGIKDSVEFIATRLQKLHQALTVTQMNTPEGGMEYITDNMDIMAQLYKLSRQWPAGDSDKKLREFTYGGSKCFDIDVFRNVLRASTPPVNYRPMLSLFGCATNEIKQEDLVASESKEKIDKNKAVASKPLQGQQQSVQTTYQDETRRENVSVTTFRAWTSEYPQEGETKHDEWSASQHKYSSKEEQEKYKSAKDKYESRQEELKKNYKEVSEDKTPPSERKKQEEKK